MYHISTDGHLNVLNFLPKWYKGIFLTSLFACANISSTQNPRSGMIESETHFKCRQILPRRHYQFTFLPRPSDGTSFPAYLVMLAIIKLYISSNLLSKKWYLSVVFFFAFPSWGARLTIFLCLCWPFVFSAVNGLFIFFPMFQLGCFFVFVDGTFLCCGYYLLITCLTNIFISVYHLCFIFNFLNSVFDGGELYTFMGKKWQFFLYRF